MPETGNPPSRVPLFLQFLPLSIFATYAFWHGEPGVDRWQKAFVIGAAAAVVQVALGWARRQPASRVALGGSAFLVTGGLAVVARQWAVLRGLGALRESAVLLFVVLVGLASVWTRAGFVGAAGGDPRAVRRASLVLLAAAIAAFLVSLPFRGRGTWVVTVALVGLVVANQWLLERLHHSEDATATGARR